MSFPAYPAYKDSGVEWLGVVPEHWAVTLLKRGYEVVLGKMLQPEARRADDEFLPYLRAANIQLAGVDIADVKRMWFGLAEKKSLLLRRDDLLVSEGGDVGRSGIWEFDEEECYFQNSINRIRSAGGNNTRFLHFFMMGIKNSGYVDVLCNKSTIAHFTAEKVAAIPLPMPTKPEQAQIARFLNHETARIDALIEEQQRLIELLKEKRQAVISHAVTKGLNPYAPMKDSGVEWLGQVPAHWAIRKLKNLVSVRGGSTPSKEVERYWDGDIPWVSPKDMKRERISSSIDHVSESAVTEGSLSIIERGVVLIVVRGMILIHSVPVAIADVDLTINQDMKAMRPGSELSCDYLSLLMQGVRDAVFQYIDSSAHGTRKLEWERFELIDLPVPTLADQLDIVSFVEEEKLAIDRLMEQAAYAISLMQERRSALISAAVTGKIDVRGWQPPTESASASAQNLQ